MRCSDNEPDARRDSLLDRAFCEMTLADFFKEYCERHSSVRKVSHKEDIEKFERHIDTDRYGVNLAKLRLIGDHASPVDSSGATATVTIPAGEWTSSGESPAHGSCCLMKCPA